MWLHIGRVDNRIHLPGGSIKAALAVATLVAATLTVASPATAAESPRVQHCISSSSGLDIQAFLGLDASVVNGFCPPVLAGSPWVPGLSFYFAKTWEQWPQGYVKAGPTPRDDFLTKFVGIKDVVDAGTPHEFTVEFSDVSRLRLYELDGYDQASTLTLGTIRPLSAGRHSVDVSILMSDVACDGTSSVVEWSCLPAGEIAAFTYNFDVVAR
ncbi:hypothetical protein [Knoellia koreensis]|uniref:Secreted protein n=1 Tax=Knoellia koreensis TaxID=2730921 RepID=A0A849H600_9MICO|nr:hypothetical protein [Knoellia sp. DB2414S]NNM45230.1 hypothetical protein [Knoellia sp. DB2414S]